jgi:hypothetical protein
MNSFEHVNFTVNGRMGSGAFEFNIENINDPTQLSNIIVQNSQIEIDGGYESENAFYIFEAKNVASTEMIIRQLFYPYRLWKSKITKPVIPVFMVFSNDIFHAFVYRFNDDKNYNSIELVMHKAYTFANQIILRSDVDAFIENIALRVEPPKIAFPQANSFERVVDLLSLLFEGELSNDEVTGRYMFEPRQTDYYITACVYLGLVNRIRTAETGIKYQLTPEAYSIMRMSYREKYLGLIRRILEFPVFNDVYFLSLDTGLVPTVSEIYSVMARREIRLGDGTKKRRASTVRNWITWIFSQFDEE